MANLVYGFTALTGGSADALDYIDGDVLVDKDIAIGCVSGIFYVYTLDADSAAAESSPGVISPVTNAGDKRWVLASVRWADTNWTQTAGTFTATPASTSTLTMTEDLTATILVGYALKYTIGGTTYYGIVSAIAAGLLTVAGAPLSGDVTALYYGDPIRVMQINVIIPGLYEDASNTDLIASDLASKLIWNKAKAYLVRYRVYSAVHDSGTHGQVSVQINNTEVNTTAGGLTIAADATWYSTVVDIAVAAYDVNPGEEIEVTAVKAGTGDASDLTVEMTFVIP